MNLIGYWQNEDQVRVGEYERREFEEKKSFAGKVNKVAKMLVRMVALEGLQPIVTEPFFKEGVRLQLKMLDHGDVCNQHHFLCGSNLCGPENCQMS